MKDLLQSQAFLLAFCPLTASTGCKLVQTKHQCIHADLAKSWATVCHLIGSFVLHFNANKWRKNISKRQKSCCLQNYYDLCINNISLVIYLSKNYMNSLFFLIHKFANNLIESFFTEFKRKYHKWDKSWKKWMKK